MNGICCHVTLVTRVLDDARCHVSEWPAGWSGPRGGGAAGRAVAAASPTARAATGQTCSRAPHRETQSHGESEPPPREGRRHTFDSVGRDRESPGTGAG